MYRFYITQNKAKQQELVNLPDWIKRGGLGFQISEADVDLVNDTDTNKSEENIKRNKELSGIDNMIHELYMNKCKIAEQELEIAKNTGIGLSIAQKKYDAIYKEFNKVYGAFSCYLALSTSTYNYDEKMKVFKDKIVDALKNNKNIKTLDFYNEFCTVADDIHVTYAFMYIIQSMKLFYINNKKIINNNPKFSSLQKEQEENRELVRYRSALKVAEQNYYDIIIDLKLAINKSVPILNAENGDNLLKKVGYKFNFKEDRKSEVSDMEEYMNYITTYDDGIKQFNQIKKIADNAVKQENENLQ